MTTRRTTIAADEDDLATLGAEAKRRGTTLTSVVAEAISEKANALRARRRQHHRLALDVVLHGNSQATSCRRSCGWSRQRGRGRNRTVRVLWPAWLLAVLRA
jgi:hypothetical protein